MAIKQSYSNHRIYTNPKFKYSLILKGREIVNARREKLLSLIGMRTLVMGIVNITPDSFSDGGKYNTIEESVNRAKALVQQGADIIDIGGETTKPGAQPVLLDDELERVIPLIKAVRKELNDTPISIDTYKAEVAKQSILAGADIINDVWRGSADPNMAKVAADLEVPIILMHNRRNEEYQSLISDMLDDLYESITMVKSAGVKKENIWIDPGLGFAKSFQDNLTVMSHLETFVSTGYPVVLGTSRKRFIGRVLDTEVDQRMEGTLATVCYGVQQGCHIIRVHDVLETVRVCRMMDAMLSAAN